MPDLFEPGQRRSASSPTLRNAPNQAAFWLVVDARSSPARSIASSFGASSVRSSAAVKRQNDARVSSSI